MQLTQGQGRGPVLHWDRMRGLRSMGCVCVKGAVPGSAGCASVLLAYPADPVAVLAPTLLDDPATGRVGVVVVASVGAFVPHAEAGVARSDELGAIVVEGCDGGVQLPHQSS